MYVCVYVHTRAYICLYIAFWLRVKNWPYAFSQSLIVNHQGGAKLHNLKGNKWQNNPKVLLQVSKVPATFHS